MENPKQQFINAYYKQERMWAELAELITEMKAARQVIELAQITDGMMPSDIAAREAAQAFMEAYPERTT
jgi:hypothetical protein